MQKWNSSNVYFLAGHTLAKCEEHGRWKSYKNVCDVDRVMNELRHHTLARGINTLDAYEINFPFGLWRTQVALPKLT